MDNKGPDRWDDREVLTQLLGVYHEEWPEEFGTPGNAISWYIEGLSEKRLKRIAGILQQLVDADMSNEDLDQLVGNELGANISFEGVGITSNEWLGQTLAIVNDGLAALRGTESRA